MGKWLKPNGDHTDEPVPEDAHFEEEYAPLEPDEPQVMTSRRLIAFDGTELVIYDEWRLEAT